MRWLVLTILLGLLATSAQAGITPYLVIARVDSFQQGVWPDANYSGCEDAKITHEVVLTTYGDSLNYGGVGDSTSLANPTGALVIGSTTGYISRVLFRWTFGTYLPASAVIDSMFIRLNFATVNADSVVGAIVLENWVEGTGDGVIHGDATDLADTTGVNWRSINRAAGATADSLWAKKGADSAFTGIPKTGTARITVTGIKDQVIGGTVVYASTSAATQSDREGAWHYCGPVLTTGVKTLNVSWARFIYNDLNATANYGFILKTANEPASGNHRVIATDSEVATAANRPTLVVYSHEVRNVVQIGGE